MRMQMQLRSGVYIAAKSQPAIPNLNDPWDGEVVVCKGQMGGLGLERYQRSNKPGFDLVILRVYIQSMLYIASKLRYTRSII